MYHFIEITGQKNWSAFGAIGKEVTEACSRVQGLWGEVLASIDSAVCRMEMLTQGTMWVTLSLKSQLGVFLQYSSEPVSIGNRTLLHFPSLFDHETLFLWNLSMKHTLRNSLLNIWFIQFLFLWTPCSPRKFLINDFPCDPSTGGKELKMYRLTIKSLWVISHFWLTN